jgi:hypothetical protein
MKTWYAAHIVMVAELTRAQQETFPAWENIVLIAADSEDEAFQKADAYGAAEEQVVDESFRWGGQPARWKYVGVRKLTECRFLADEPCDLGDATYFELEFPSRAAIENYVAGRDQQVLIRDPFPEPRPATLSTAESPKRPPKRKGA